MYLCDLDEQYSVEVSWVLYLVLKAVLKGTNSLSAEDNLAILYESEFIQCIVHLAGLGTGFSKQWLMSDLEVSLFDCLSATVFNSVMITFCFS